MATIKNLAIRSLADGRVLPINSIEGDVTIGELIDAYRGEMKLAREHKVILKRKSTGKELPNASTIEHAGIQDDETLIAESDLIAGAARS